MESGVSDEPLSMDAPFGEEILSFQEDDRRTPPTKGQVLLIGSSSFVILRDIGLAFGGFPLINRAFGGSTLLDQIRYVDRVVTPYAPRAVVLYCGENDFAEDPELTCLEVVSRFKTLFGMIRERTAQVPFVYISMKPSPSRWDLVPKFRDANAQIADFLRNEPRTAFVDVWAVMLKNGRPDPLIFDEDELHMNEEGYRRWKPLVEVKLAMLL